MTELKIFESSEFGSVRTLMINEEPYFIGNDVATVLGYADPKDAIRKHVDEEDKRVIQKGQIATLEIPNRGLTIINESGLYSLILSSKLPTAKRFKHWVTSEVLPAIRKHGAYATDAVIDQVLGDPDFGIKLLTELKTERQKRKELEAKNGEMLPKAIFADAVAASHTSILIGDLAKMLKQNGIEMGQKRLFAWLRDNGYLIKRQGADWNSPTQRAMEMKLFEIKESTITHADGHITVSKTTKVTGKGQAYFVNLFLGNGRKMVAA